MKKEQRKKEKLKRRIIEGDKVEYQREGKRKKNEVEREERKKRKQ